MSRSKLGSVEVYWLGFVREELRLDKVKVLCEPMYLSFKNSEAS